MRDRAGERIGRLTVVSLVSVNGKKSRWRCVCDCGTVKTLWSSNLRSGNRSCGCHTIKHHMTGTKEYHAWQAMKTRCYNRKAVNYDDYGGRGIRVCERWRKSFAAFFKDIGLAPSAAHSIDRYPNNNGDYRPRNVRWATRKQQRSNQWR